MADTHLVHLASAAAPGIDVAFLDTGYHFAETIGTRDAVAEVYPVRLLNITPLRTVAEQDAEYGPRLYERDPDRCCAMRKVEPLERALKPYTAWVNGMRREESPTRADIPVIGYDAKRDMVKISPLAAWTQDDLDAYIADARRADQPPVPGGLHLDRLRALHAQAPAGRGPAGRPLGRQRQDRMRTAHLT